MKWKEQIIQKSTKRPMIFFALKTVFFSSFSNGHLDQVRHLLRQQVPPLKDHLHLMPMLPMAVGAGVLWEVAPVGAKGDAPGPGDHC